MEILIIKDQFIASERTGKTLKCYNVMPYYRGYSNDIVGYEYAFWDSITMKARSIKQSELKSMLNGVWYIVNP